MKEGLRDDVGGDRIRLGQPQLDNAGREEATSLSARNNVEPSKVDWPGADGYIAACKAMTNEQLESHWKASLRIYRSTRGDDRDRDYGRLLMISKAARETGRGQLTRIPKPP